ncbi:MAG: M56 family metallopeptidase [Tepidisphaeraceae bacterium]
MTPLLHATTSAIGWTLLHSMWIAAAGWAANAGLQFAARRASCHVRYVLAAAAFASIVAGVIAALFIQISGPEIALPTAPPGQRLPLLSLPHSPEWLTVIAGAVAPVAPLLVLVWVVVAALELARNGYGITQLKPYTERAVRRQIVEPAAWRSMCLSMVPKFSVLLAESPDAKAPVTYGWWRPVVCVPAGFLSGTSPQILNALLAHELAHIARRDYLVNLVQTVFENILWFNPFLHSVGRQVRELTEQCCDDMAVRASNVTPRDYAGAMIQLCQSRHSALQLGITGSPTARRIRVMLHSPFPQEPAHSKRAYVAALLACILLFGGGNTVAYTAGRQIEVAFSSRDPLPQEIYNTLHCNGENAIFVAAVRESVLAMKSGTLSDEKAQILAEIILSGVQPDALLKDSLASMQSDSREAYVNSEWQKNWPLQCDELARELETKAFSARNSAAQKTLARAAVLLAAQDRLFPGGSLARMVRNPKFLELASTSQREGAAVFAAASRNAVFVSETLIRLRDWQIQNPSLIPADLERLARNHAWIQWVLANYINEVMAVDGARSESLIRSIRAPSKLRITSGLLLKHVLIHQEQTPLPRNRQKAKCTEGEAAHSLESCTPHRLQRSRNPVELTYTDTGNSLSA